MCLCAWETFKKRAHERSIRLAREAALRAKTKGVHALHMRLLRSRLRQRLRAMARALRMSGGKASAGDLLAKAQHAMTNEYVDEEDAGLTASFGNLLDAALNRSVPLFVPQSVRGIGLSAEELQAELERADAEDKAAAEAEAARLAAEAVARAEAERLEAEAVAEAAARAAAAEQAAAAERLAEAERAWAATEAAREAAELDALTNTLAQIAQAPAETPERSALASTVSGLLGLLTGKTATSDPVAITRTHDPRRDAVLHSPQPKNIPPTSALAKLQSMLGIFQHADAVAAAPPPANVASQHAGADTENADAWVNNLLGRSPQTSATTEVTSTEDSVSHTADSFASGTLYADLGTAVAKHLQSFENGLAAGGSPPPGATRYVQPLADAEVGPSRSPTLTLPGSIFPDVGEASFAIPPTHAPTVPVVAPGSVAFSPPSAVPAAPSKATPDAVRAKKLFLANSPLAQPLVRGRSTGGGAKAGKGSFSMAPRTGILLANSPLTVGASAVIGGAGRSLSPRPAAEAAPSPVTVPRSQSSPRTGQTPKPAPSPYVVAKPSPSSRVKASPRDDKFTVPAPVPSGTGATPSAPSVTPWTREGDSLFSYLDQFGLGSIAEPAGKGRSTLAGRALNPLLPRAASGLRVVPPQGAASHPVGAVSRTGMRSTPGVSPREPGATPKGATPKPNK